MVRIAKKTDPKKLAELKVKIHDEEYLLNRIIAMESALERLAADDRLPERFYTESGSSGDGIDIPPINRERLQEELRTYYRMRGLTPDGTFADADFLELQP